MAYHKRVIIFLTTMVATAIVLVAFFIHGTLNEIKSLDASSIPLPALGAEDQKQLHDLLQEPANSGSTAPENHNAAQDNTSAPQNPSDTSGQNLQPADGQSSIPQIPAKAMQ